MALLVMGFTGLVLLLGFLLLGGVAGTYEWSAFVSSPLVIQGNSLLFPLSFIFLLVGIFGKSAQIPFYFWLPRAMVAPTPVSAYLHAATMVKLGIFLTARIYPIFVHSDLWFPLMTTFCFTTMVVGAFLSLVSHELKEILAYATLSQLGFFIGFYGLGDAQGVQYDFIHIFNHALYKGSLFMLVGIVHEATGIHDIRRLGGLWKKMPLTAVIFFVAAAAMAGIPGSTGFLSKELFLADLLAFGRAHPIGWMILFAVGFASLFKVAFSIRLFYHIFIRPPPEKIEAFFQPQGFAIHLSPLILSSAALYFGFTPSFLIKLSETFYVSGLHASTTSSGWHGGGLEMVLGGVILLVGTGFFLFAEKIGWQWGGIERFLQIEPFFWKTIDGIQRTAKWSVKWIYTDKPHEGVALLMGVVVVLVGGGMLGLLIHPVTPHFPSFDVESTGGILRWIITSFSIVAAFGAIFIKTSLGQFISLSISGFFVTLYFVFYKAPDLAMTQLLVEVAILFFVLFFMKGMWEKDHGHDIKTRKQTIHIALSIGMGITAALLAAISIQTPIEEHLGNYYLQYALSLTGGANVVNDILIDFRGLDTLGEVTVLFGTAIAAIALWSRRKNKAVSSRFTTEDSASQ